MALPGAGFLAIWNDVTEPAEQEWLDWHNREHIPERVGVQGFRAGRRYADPRLGLHRYFTLYIGENVATFSSPPYVERLNNPTPWTTKLAPDFRNFVRGACRVVASAGRGKGGAILTVRVGVAGRLDAAGASALVEKISGQRGLIGAHLGVSDAAVTGVPTREKSLRGDKAEPVFQGVLLIEANGRAVLDAAAADIRTAVGGAGLGLTPAETAIYDLSFGLDKAEL